MLKIKKRAPRCMGMLRRKKKRAPRCMGTFFEYSWSPNMGSLKTPPYRKIKRRSAETEKKESSDRTDSHGRPRTIEKQSARVSKMKRCKNDGAPSIGKQSMGAPNAPRHHEAAPPHTAWERDFITKKIPTLHGSTDASAAPRRPTTSPPRPPDN